MMLFYVSEMLANYILFVFDWHSSQPITLNGLKEVGFDQHENKFNTKETITLPPPPFFVSDSQ